MDQAVSAAEANRSFSHLLRDVRGGRSYVVTAHGKPVARITPWQGKEPSRAAAREALLRRLEAQDVCGLKRWTREELYARDSSR